MGYTASDETTEVTSRPNPHHQDHDDDDAAGQLARQSSIYSLTLDEIQNTVCEPGKHFGSMNMDEFLANIWTAEEEATHQLHRQGSLTLPAPLSGKTVDEVWAQIHGDQHHPFRHHQPQPVVDRPASAAARNANHRQPTFGEMTLEDFLVKAGVVREATTTTPQQPQTPAALQYGVPGGYHVSPNDPGFDHMVGASYEDHSSTMCGYTADGNGGGGDVGGGYNAAMPFSRRMSNGYGAAAASPPSEDGTEGGQVDDTGGFVGGGAEGRNYRKRAADGSVEKVVERRQRRMIKNRESAARSRARKQAYTVELEAELNQLREENDRLRKEQMRIAAMRKQLILDAMAERAYANAWKAKRILQRCRSCSW